MVSEVDFVAASTSTRMIFPEDEEPIEPIVQLDYKKAKLLISTKWVVLSISLITAD